MLISPFPSQEGRRTAYKVFGSAATAPRRARAFVRCQLRGWELADLAETAELVVSELVTNAVRATDAVVSPPMASSMFPVALRTVALRVRVAPGRPSLFIEVWDVSDRDPVPHGEAGGELGESGRGLVLVGSLARRWGHYSAPDRGKIVWCELAISPVEGARSPGAAGAPAAGSVPGGRPGPAAVPAAGRQGTDRQGTDRQAAAVAVAAEGASAGTSAGTATGTATGTLPRRVRRHPVGARDDGPDEATLLRVLEGLRALDVSGPDRR
ncbi:ATP-binding protein [Microbispora rosea]|uniref:ATP-binding protein n=1 Tax=Microbispora rosea TaxID=58117 RepID=UPI0034268049